MISFILEISGKYLIEFMGGMLAVCFVIRWFSYISSKRNDAYFSTLAREITIAIEKDKEKQEGIASVDAYLGKMFSEITDKLPNRSFRFKEKNSPGDKRNVVSFEGYLHGREGFVNILKSESGVFHCQTPPNFSELTQRILSQDQQWSTLFKHLPIEGISRMIDIMPGLFVVFGIFGTFVGISLALPEIANIDFQNIETSGATLASFVKNTAYAMETSLAGIVFSVLTTLMNTMYPIKDMRNRIHKKVETSLQNLWYHIHSSTKIESEILVTLKAIQNALQKNAEKEDVPELPTFERKAG